MPQRTEKTSPDAPPNCGVCCLSFSFCILYFCQLCAGPGDLRPHRFRSWAAFHRAPGNAVEQVNGLIEVFLKGRMRRLIGGKRQGFQSAARFHALFHQRTHHMIGVPEGHAFFRQVIGTIGGVE